MCKKGVVAQTVKEVVEELCADGLVSQDKIGTSNYFWSFPSQGLIVRRKKIETLEASLEGKKRRREELEEEQSKLEVDRNAEQDDGFDREGKLKRLAALREEESAVDAELAELRANDPELLKALQDDVAQAQAAVERWTDNISTMRDFATQTFGMESSAFDSQFECEGME